MNTMLESLNAQEWDKVKSLISSGEVNLNDVDENGNTALMLCCVNSCSPEEEEIMNLLLDNHADSNIVDSRFKRNPLMAILEINRPEITKRLLTLTDLTIRDKEGHGVLTNAICHGKQDVIDLICKTAKNHKDIQEFSSQLVFPSHSLTPYAQNLLHKINLNFSLNEKLVSKEIKRIKKKI